MNDIINVGDLRLNLETLPSFEEKGVSAAELQWFENLDPADREEMLYRWLRAQRVDTFNSKPFTLELDLGTVTVPEDYDHATCLTTFRERSLTRKDCKGIDGDMADHNFPNPSRVLVPGERLRVNLFTTGKYTSSLTSREYMSFLETQRAVHVGAQGLSLVIDQKLDEIPSGFNCVSFDRRCRLLSIGKGVYTDHLVPTLYIHPTDTSAGCDERWGFFAKVFGGKWPTDTHFFCFTEAE